MRRGDDQDLANPGQHQRGERIVYHRLIVNRQQLLAELEGNRPKPTARAACEDDPLHVATAAGPELLRRTRSIRKVSAGISRRRAEHFSCELLLPDILGL